MRKPLLLVFAIAVMVAGLWTMKGALQPRPQFAPALQSTSAPAPRAPAEAAPARGDGLPPFLPPEAVDTLAKIQQGGPFPHRQDGSVFGNREGRLPPRPRGYYREYTVETPGLSHRGGRRIVTGGEPPEVWYYSEDHYGSFRSFGVPALAQEPP